MSQSSWPLTDAFPTRQRGLLMSVFYGLGVCTGPGIDCEQDSLGCGNGITIIEQKERYCCLNHSRENKKGFKHFLFPFLYNSMAFLGKKEH